MNDTIKFYDLVADRAAADWYENETLLPTIKLFLELFTNKPKILDLGCGPGYETKRLEKCGAIVEGLDFSYESIRIAKQHNPNIKFHHLNYDDITQDIGTFDGIFASASLIHLSSEKLISTINRIKQIHTKNGYFLNLFWKGEGQKIQYPIINDVKIERIIERYNKGKMIDIFNACKYKYITEFEIEDDPDDIWMCLIFKKVDI
jgi:SAM-dependent methyltransferase